MARTTKFSTRVAAWPSQKSIRSSPSHAGSASSQILNGSTRRSSKIASNTSPHRDPVQQGHITSSLPKPSLLPTVHVTLQRWRLVQLVQPSRNFSLEVQTLEKLKLSRTAWTTRACDGDTRSQIA